MMGEARGKTSLWKLALILAPFATTTVAINLFLAGLLLSYLGLPVLSPLEALAWAVPLGIPATWAAALWVRRLMAEADS